MFFSKISDLCEDALSCLTPILCESCNAPLCYEEQVFCVPCHRNLPTTDFHLLPSNPFIDKFFGRLDLHAGAAFLYFSKNGLAQQIIHQLKYKGRSQLGKNIGRLYGEYLLESSLFKDIDIIIPIPLHPKRQLHRGYNQSASIGLGLSQSMNIPIIMKAVERHRETSTQTRKSRIDRFNNLDGAFRVKAPNTFTNKHILLVDDVLTTGATLEGCALEFYKISGIRVSMATIGFAYFQ